MLSFYASILFPLITSADPSLSVPSLQKALEFQYKQKLAALEKENRELKQSLSKAKHSGSSCQISISHSDSPKTVESENLDSTYGEISTTTENVLQENQLYRRALREIQNESWNQALLTLEGFVHSYPASEMAPNAIYWMGQIYMEKSENGLARAEFSRLIQIYPKSERAQRALARLAMLESKP